MEKQFNQSDLAELNTSKLTGLKNILTQIDDKFGHFAVSKLLYKQSIKPYIKRVLPKKHSVRTKIKEYLYRGNRVNMVVGRLISLINLELELKRNVPTLTKILGGPIKLAVNQKEVDDLKKGMEKYKDILQAHTDNAKHNEKNNTVVVNGFIPFDRTINSGLPEYIDIEGEPQFHTKSIVERYGYKPTINEIPVNNKDFSEDTLIVTNDIKFKQNLLENINVNQEYYGFSESKPKDLFVQKDLEDLDYTDLCLLESQIHITKHKSITDLIELIKKHHKESNCKTKVINYLQKHHWGVGRLLHLIDLELNERDKEENDLNVFIDALRNATATINTFKTIDLVPVSITQYKSIMDLIIEANGRV